MLIGVGVSYRISYSVVSYCVSFRGLNTSIGEESADFSAIHYANTPMQYTAILHGCKNVHFR